MWEKGRNTSDIHHDYFDTSPRGVTSVDYRDRGDSDSDSDNNILHTGGDRFVPSAYSNVEEILGMVPEQVDEIHKLIDRYVQIGMKYVVLTDTCMQQIRYKQIETRVLSCSLGSN